MPEQNDDEMLFPWISRHKKKLLEEKNLKHSDLINLGIGDVCHPVPKVISDALKKCIDKMSLEAIGYGEEEGRADLREKLCEVTHPGFSKEEIFITEGIANSLGLLISIFKEGSKIGIQSPTYPVYKSLLKTSRMEVFEIECNDDLTFTPPQEKLDGIILCSPNNPTGVAFTKEELKKWVNWANTNKTAILFDGAYEAFVSEGKPRSIYAVEGARTCAIEMRSFSKSLGFTALRLGHFVFPKELNVNGFGIQDATDLIRSKTNGVSYLIQEAGIAALSEEGQRITSELTSNYMKMTRKLKDKLIENGETVIGGIDAPYLFCKVEGSSKEKFLTLLNELHIVTIPGIGFGMDGYVRLSGFINEEILNKALKALSL